MTIPAIDAWAQSQWGFYVDRHWDADGGRWVLERGPIQLARYHGDILRHCFTTDSDGKLPYDTVALAEPAKSGKSAIAALVHEYFALHVDPGSEQYIASGKQDQAQSRVYKSLCESVRWNPHLRLEPYRYELTLRNGTIVKAIPNNARTEAGARFTLFSYDEPWNLVYEGDRRLVDEFKADPTRTTCVRLFTGYAGYLESKFWLDQLERGLAGEPVPELGHITNDGGEPACWRNGRHFVFWSRTCRQPWQTSEWIEGLRTSLRPSEFERMVRCSFVHSVGDFLPPGVWERLVDPVHKPLSPGSRRPVYVGLDLATKPGGDDAALIGVYRDGGTVRVAFHRLWKGKGRREGLRLSETVEPCIKLLAEAYNLQGIWFDPYQGLQMAENLRRAGILCYEVAQTHGSRGPRDTALWEAAVNGDLVLYDDPDLRDAAAYASAKELGNGLIFLTKAGRGQIDLLVALSNCLAEARRPPGVYFR